MNVRVMTELPFIVDIKAKKRQAGSEPGAYTAPLPQDRSKSKILDRLHIFISLKQCLTLFVFPEKLVWPSRSYIIRLLAIIIYIKRDNGLCLQKIMHFEV